MLKPMVTTGNATGEPFKKLARLLHETFKKRIMPVRSGGIMKLSNEVLVIVLVVLLGIGALVVRNFPFSQGDLDKDMPPTITSFDLFAGTSWTKWIHDSEDARSNPPYRVMGVQSLTVQPVYYFLFIAAFTKLTTINAYQTTQLLTHLSSVLVILVLFVLVRRALGWKVALISTVLAAFPAALWMFQMYIGFQYDQYAFLFVPATMFFLIAFFTKQLDRRQLIIAGVLIGFFAVTMWLSHYVELFLYGPLFGALWLFFLWKEKSFKDYFLLAGIIALVVLPYVIFFYPLTAQGHLAGGFAQNFNNMVNLGTPSPYPSYWPHPRFTFWLNLLGLAGLAFVGVKTFKRSWNRTQALVLILIAYIIAIGLSNYIGIDANRTARQLFNGLAAAVVFPALGIYLLYMLATSAEVLKKFSIVLLLILLAGIAYVSAPRTFNELRQIDQGTFVDDQKWESIRYIRDHTPSSSKVFYLNGVFHEFAMFGERVFSEGWVLPNPESAQFNFQHLCSGNWTPVYAGHWGNAEFAFATQQRVYIKDRPGWNTFTYVAPFDYPEAKNAFVYNNTISYVPLPFFDYAVVEYKGTQLDPCVAFFLNQSLERGHTLAWNNNKMAILKINKEAKP